MNNIKIKGIKLWIIGIGIFITGIVVGEQYAKFKIKHTHLSQTMSNSEQWKKRNTHNETNILDCELVNIDNVIVGKRTYGTIAIQTYPQSQSRLKIGNYVSIANNVHFLLDGEHPYKGISTFPFKVKLGTLKYEAKSKGDIVIDDDVWIGLGATICAGVHVKQGAIIAAGSVVTKNVEPYSIVGGNPAKHIKYRFSEKIIKRLKNIDFSKIDEELFRKNISTVYKEVTEDNIEYILKELNI